MCCTYPVYPSVSYLFCKGEKIAMLCIAFRVEEPTSQQYAWRGKLKLGVGNSRAPHPLAMWYCTVYLHVVPSTCTVINTCTCVQVHVYVPTHACTCSSCMCQTHVLDMSPLWIHVHVGVPIHIYIYHEYWQGVSAGRVGWLHALLAILFIGVCLCSSRFVVQVVLFVVARLPDLVWLHLTVKCMHLVTGVAFSRSSSDL